jgi:RNA polymerase sigma-70 factor, ECF subfamily
MKEEKVQAAATQIRSLPEPPRELENLFREYYDRVFRAAYRITGSYVDAEDVLQTVFLRLARRNEDIDLTPNPEGYLLRAAVNAALDLVRSRVRSKSVPLEDMETELTANPRLSPEAQHEDRELQKQIRKAIATLGESAAEIFVLRYIEGYDNREIAKILGKSQLVVAVVLHRARGRLRKEIGQFLEECNEKN